MMTTPMFSDPVMQRFFDKEGFVKLPLLDASEVATLSAFYKTLALNDKNGAGFHVNMDRSEGFQEGGISEKIYGVVLPKASVHLKDVKHFTASFMVKEPNADSHVPVHQDLTFIKDEGQFNSVTCWVPLQDVNIENGALGLIRGSHRFFSNYRPSPLPQAPWPISSYGPTILPYLQILEMKAGEALIFDGRTFHGSLPNITNTSRIAIGVAFIQQQAKLAHYYLKPGTVDTVLEYEVDEKFFKKYPNNILSEMYERGDLIEGYKLLGEKPHILPKFTSNELVERMKENGNEFNADIYKRVSKLLNKDASIKGTLYPELPGRPENIVNSRPEIIAPVSSKMADKRTFLQKYAPINVLREIKRRLTGG